MEIDAQGQVVVVGDRCSVNIPLEDTAPWYAAVADAPPAIAGTLTRLPAPRLSATITWAPTATMSIRIYAAKMSTPTTELLTALRVQPKELLFAGDTNFCARVAFRD
jgi:hypothetical protein